MIFSFIIEECLSSVSDEPVVTVEVQLSPAVKIAVSGRDLERLYEVLKRSIESAGNVLDLVEKTRSSASMQERRIPQELLSGIKEMSNKDLVLVLLYYESPLSREQINQRTREIGREVSKAWLNTEFFRKPVKDLFLSETDQSGARVYRLSELGRLEAEKVIKQVMGQASL